LRSEDRVTWLQAVFATWQAKAGTERHWSSMEYATAEKWLSRGIPLMIVINGINEFEGVPRRLEACEQSVERAYAYWFKAMGGR
jgi:hypothetical protein